MTQPDPPTTRRALRTRATQEAPKTKTTPKRKRAVWIWGTIITIVIATGAGALAAKRLYDQAIGVRAHLEAAVVSAGELKSAVVAGDSATAATAAATFSLEADAAASGTQGRLWQLAASFPALGANFAALATVTEVVDALSSDVLTPASAISLDSLKPQAGRIDIAAVSALTPTIENIDGALEKASVSLASVDRTGLLPEVADGLQRFESVIADVRPFIAPLKEIVSVLPSALGANAPRDYLLMFQGTSETRSLGGNAAVFIVLRAEQGALTIVEHVSSQDFHNAPPAPILALDPQAESIYGNKIGRYTADFTMVPDFPYAVTILQAWWEREGFHPFDAVISVDPVALSYLLAATGPVTLPTGDTLSAENAAPLLLNEVYFRYEDPFEQNAFFSAAADSVFNLVVGGAYSPISFFNEIARAANEGRVLYWSDSAAEMALVSGARMSGAMTTDSQGEPTIGVYVNDNTGSKMSYYLDMAIAVCRTDRETHGNVTLSSAVTASEASRLPGYITGPYFEPGTVSTYVVIYGPVGSSLTHIDLDGSPATVLALGEHLNRPAVKVEVINMFESTHDLAFSFAGAGTTGPIDVWHTPMTRPTDVDLSGSCSE